MIAGVSARRRGELDEGSVLPLVGPFGGFDLPPVQNRMTRRAGPGREAVAGQGRRETPQPSEPSQGAVRPSGRNHLHRVKPVMHIEAMIDRQESQRSGDRRSRPPDTSA